MEKHEQEPEDTIENPPSKKKMQPPQRQLDSQPPTNPNTQPKSPSPPHELHSPPPEPELQPPNRNPPSRVLSPPLEPLYNLKPQPPPALEFPPQGQQQDHQKQPPFEPQTTIPADPVSAAKTKFGPTSDGANEERGHINMGSGRRFMRPNLTILRRTKRENMVQKSLLGLRVCGFVFSLISFSVLAADRDRGWALDSFYRYKEFRYCMAVNVIAFVYSGFQAYDLAYQLTAGKRKVKKHLRYYLDFSVDQMLTYLLISASSSAAVRVDDWQSNWGKDEFPDMAKASMALSFLAFVSLAFSSLISGYALCNLKSM